MRKILMICLAIIIITQPIYAGENTVEAVIIDRVICNKLGHDISTDFTLPVLSYNDHTYIAVKDIANYFGLRAEWIPSLDWIRLMQPEKEDFYVKSDTMAINLAKAAINEYFSEYITEQTVYFAHLNGPVSVGNGYRYFVWVAFDFEQTHEDDVETQIIDQSQICIQIEPSNGAIELIEFYETIEPSNGFELPSNFIG